MSLTANVSNCLSTSKLLNDFTNEIKTSSFRDFVLSPVDCLFRWADALFGCPTSMHVRKLQPLQSAFALPNAILFLGETRTSYQKYRAGADGVKATDPVQNFSLFFASACETPMFLHTVEVISFKSLKTLSAGFWSALCVFDIINIRNEWNRANKLQNELSNNVAGSKINYHKLNHAYFSILQSLSTVAMGSIGIVSALFASIAHGVLFSPITFLALSTSWVVLNYTNFFYGKVIEQWEKGKSAFATA